jgi:protein TonB
MALSEYMPYGAPELLDGERARLARSTLAASLAVAMIVCGVGAIVARSGTATTTILVPPWDQIWVPPLVERQENYRTTPPVPPAPQADPHSVVLPVPDPVAPPDEFHDASALPSAQDNGGHAGPATLTGHDGVVPPVEADPDPGSYRYVDELPNPIRCAEATYPDLAREAGVEGTVRVLMLVGLDGRVEKAIIAPHGSIPLLDDAALTAARRCVFTPALVNAHPVKLWVSQNWRFSLH